MQALIKEYEKGLLKPEGELPEIKPGDTVRLKINIYEGRGDRIVGLKKIHRIAAKGKERRDTKIERVQTFEGTVIAVKGKGVRQKITVRKLASGVGVEKSYFVHSRKVASIEVMRRAKVRRAKLYYLRNRVGKATRLKERRDAQRPRAPQSKPGGAAVQAKEQ
ncbi:50S ribosomal protein L19 [bacterium]|nr:50S ribosomal protein L19 [bacterium]